MKRTVLIVLDGFGERMQREGNAIRLARTPHFDALYRDFPHTTIATSGLAVGLPEGQMGNSEVGHMNMGSGRVVYQDLTRINHAIQSGEFFHNAVLLDAIEKVKASGGRLHLIGLTSPGGVHSSLEHAYATLQLCKQAGLTHHSEASERVLWHAFLDGRDTPPRSAADTLRAVDVQLKSIGIGRIASVIGRYYAMDRDNRWDRIEIAYRLLVGGEGALAVDAVSAIEASYRAGDSDEFVKPTVILDSRGAPSPPIRDGDAVLFFNFRSDRARELTRALTALENPGFVRSIPAPKLAAYVCMCQYDKTLPLPVAFQPQSLEMILGEYLAGLGLAQLRSAETEKYAHVTFFFNGGREEPFPGEDRRLVSSRRDVATYDAAPEMSAVSVADGIVAAIDKEHYAFILVNFANPDMVGHTGVLTAAISAIDTIDACVGRIVGAALAHDTAIIITADHGNCEMMLDANGNPHTAHTTNPVPFIVVDDKLRNIRLQTDGRLCDVAPTILDLMGLPIPRQMEGHSLLPRNRAATGG